MSASQVCISVPILGSHVRSAEKEAALLHTWKVGPQLCCRNDKDKCSGLGWAYRQSSHQLVEGELDGSRLADSSNEDGVLAQGLDDIPGWQVLGVLISTHHDDQGTRRGLRVRALNRCLNVLDTVLGQLLTNLAALIRSCIQISLSAPCFRCLRLPSNCLITIMVH